MDAIGEAMSAVLSKVHDHAQKNESAARLMSEGCVDATAKAHYKATAEGFGAMRDFCEGLAIREGVDIKATVEATQPAPYVGDLYQQVEAKRVHDCPKCGANTDVDNRPGPEGLEHFEFCPEDACDWERDLGTEYGMLH